jgi:hypothetical protein
MKNGGFYRAECHPCLPAGKADAGGKKPMLMKILILKIDTTGMRSLLRRDDR